MAPLDTVLSVDKLYIYSRAVGIWLRASTSFSARTSSHTHARTHNFTHLLALSALARCVFIYIARPDPTGGLQ